MRREHVRSWDLARLLSPPEQTARRCNAIEHLSQACKALPRIRFEINATHIIRTQEWIADGRSVYRGGDERSWMLLAEALEAKEAFDLVHGDLCVRNVIWSVQRGCCLAVDWEPDLVQWVGNQRVYKVTKGYVHPKDWGTAEPFSQQSDRYAFVRCLEQVRRVELLSEADAVQSRSYSEWVKEAFWKL
ncbi:MAG: hypothetical protein ACO2ZL_06535 [Flavobacteriales bacterium]